MEWFTYVKEARTEDARFMQKAQPCGKETCPIGHFCVVAMRECVTPFRGCTVIFKSSRTIIFVGPNTKDFLE
jgi:hypothetical protein